MLVVVVACAGAAQLTQAAAGSSCAAVQYLGALHRADATVSAASPDPAAAAGILTSLVRSDGTLKPTLAPIIDDLDATPADIAGARASLDAQVQVLALPRGATCNVDSGPASSALKQVYRSPVFTNLDQKPQPGWLENILKPFQDPEIVVVGGFTVLGHNDLLSRTMALSWIFDLPDERDATVKRHKVHVNNCAVRTEFFKAHPFPDLGPGVFKKSCGFWLRGILAKSRWPWNFPTNYAVSSRASCTLNTPTPNL